MVMNVTEKILPSFLIPGVAKSGTTSIFFYLNQHPQVEVPVKETFYYISDIIENTYKDDPARRNTGIVNSEKEYKKLFHSIPRGKVSGEISTAYFYYYQESIPMIKRLLGDQIKVPIILRNPADRAISSYKHFKRDHLETCESMSYGLAFEEKRMRENWDFMWYYKDLGFYSESYKAFSKHFKNCKVFLYDDLQNDPIAFMQSIYSFIGVDNNFIPDVKEQYNTTKGVKSEFIHDLMTKEGVLKRILKPVTNNLISRSTRYKIKQRIKAKNFSIEGPTENFDLINEKLRDVYGEDLAKLEKLTSLDLTPWKKNNQTLNGKESSS